MLFIRNCRNKIGGVNSCVCGRSFLTPHLLRVR
nr:MAG TPA: IscA [Caudoviricetes sp.]